MKQYLSLILCITSFSLCNAEQPEPSVIAQAYQGLTESVEGAITDAQEIIADAQEACAPVVQEFQTLLDDVRADYQNMATYVHDSLQTARTKCQHAYKRTLAYLVLR